MFLDALLARRAIARTFANISYWPSETIWREIKKGIYRDLQSRRLRPDVPIQPRRQICRYVSQMTRETGSSYQGLSSLLFDGAWTSSGGSFRLAEAIQVDLGKYALERAHQDQGFRFLEIGAGWAGFKHPRSVGVCQNVADLALLLKPYLGKSAFLHFTNLTKWHSALPSGVFEHPHLTAASLKAIESQGVTAASVDIIYSQAAAYFEQDLTIFLFAAARLLRPNGRLIFNYRTELAEQVVANALAAGLRRHISHDLGGMNGQLVCFVRDKPNLSLLGTEALIERLAVAAAAR